MDTEWNLWGCVTGYLDLCNRLHVKKCFFFFLFFAILWHVGNVTHCVCDLVCFCRSNSWYGIEQHLGMVQNLEHEGLIEG